MTHQYPDPEDVVPIFRYPDPGDLWQNGFGQHHVTAESENVNSQDHVLSTAEDEEEEIESVEWEGSPQLSDKRKTRSSTRKRYVPFRRLRS